MTDYSAYDIHLLDQAAPDAFNDVDQFIGDPEQKRRLAERGPAVYAAELTRDLAASAANPTSLAAWAAIATVRLMEAGKAWEEDTDLAFDQRDAARAMADELRAELAKARRERDEYAADNTRVAVSLVDVQRQLTAANHHTDGLAADVRDMQKANTAYANENARLRKALVYLAADAAIEAENWSKTRPGESGEALAALCDAVKRTAEVAQLPPTPRTASAPGNGPAPASPSSSASNPTTTAPPPNGPSSSAPSPPPASTGHPPLPSPRHPTGKPSTSSAPGTRPSTSCSTPRSTPRA